MRPVAALRARVQLAQDKIGDALAWAHDRHLSATDTLSYLHEFEHITLARILLAQNTAGRTDGPRHEATGLLERLLAAAKEGHRTGSVIEITVLQALDHRREATSPLRVPRWNRRWRWRRRRATSECSSTKAQP